jgi:hypothetical protein
MNMTVVRTYEVGANQMPLNADSEMAIDFKGIKHLFGFMCFGKWEMTTLAAQSILLRV